MRIFSRIIGKEDDRSGDKREPQFPGVLGEAETDATTAHPLQKKTQPPPQYEEQNQSGSAVSTIKMSSIIKKIGRADRSGDDGRFGETNTDAATIHPLLPKNQSPFQDKEQPSGPKLQGQTKDQQGEAPGRFGEAVADEAIIHYLQSPLKQQKEQRTVSKCQGLEGNEQKITSRDTIDHCSDFKNQDLENEEAAQVSAKDTETEGEALTIIVAVSDQAVARHITNLSLVLDDTDEDEEQRPGAFRVPGPFGTTSSGDSFSWTDSYSVSNEPIAVESVAAIYNLPIIAELTEDIEQRVQRQVEEQVKVEVEKLLRNQQQTQNHTITDAVEVEQAENKTWFGIAHIWFLCTNCLTFHPSDKCGCHSS